MISFCLGFRSYPSNRVFKYCTVQNLKNKPYNQPLSAPNDTTSLGDVAAANSLRWGLWSKLSEHIFKYCTVQYLINEQQNQSFSAPNDTILLGNVASAISLNFLNDFRIHFDERA